MSPGPGRAWKLDRVVEREPDRVTRRRITFITSGLATGGSELQLTQLALGVRELGWEVDVVSLQRGGLYAARLKDAGIPVLDCPTGRVPDPVSLARLVGHLRRRSPDVVHTQAFRANLAGRLAAILTGRAVVASVRATYEYLPRSYFWIERRLARRTAYVVTPSKATSAHLVREIRVPADKVRTIPNGVDSELFNPNRSGGRFRARLGLDGRFVVLVAGRLVGQKNHEAVLRAFSIFAAGMAQATLLVAGDGPLAGTLKRRAAMSGARVLFLGELGREDLADAMAAADVLLSMSDFEGMPNVLLEAMAAGRPVVATGVDGVAELVADGVEGFVVPRGDEQAAAAALARLASAPDLRARLGEAGRAKVVREYGIRVNVARHADLYESLLEGPGPGRCARTT